MHRPPHIHLTFFFFARQSLSNVFLPASHPTTPSDDPHPGHDILASILLLLVPHPSPATEANIVSATRQANLVLVGAIIVGSIRRVLHGAARALRATPASRNRVASLVLLVLAQLMVRLDLSPGSSADGSRRAYTSSRRSCSCARRSHLRRTARVRGYSRCCPLTRRSDLCSIGASSPAPRWGRRSSGRRGGRRSCDLFVREFLPARTVLENRHWNLSCGLCSFWGPLRFAREVSTPRIRIGMVRMVILLNHPPRHYCVAYEKNSLAHSGHGETSKIFFCMERVVPLSMIGQKSFDALKAETIPGKRLVLKRVVCRDWPKAVLVFFRKEALNYVTI